MLTLGKLHAQERVVVTGGNALGIDGTVSYTVVTVQQPYDITLVTGIEDNNISLLFLAYPNPTTDYLTLKVNDFEPSILRFRLFDMSGQMLLSKQITANETNIPMSKYERGIYFLKITGTKQMSSKEIKTFKIIKK